MVRGFSPGERGPSERERQVCHGLAAMAILIRPVKLCLLFPHAVMTFPEQEALSQRIPKL